MKKLIVFATFLFILLNATLKAQDEFDFDLSIHPVQIDSMPGIHSFAYGQHNGKWLLVGGRVDGLHPRQPFRSFPLSHNNNSFWVVDSENSKVWSAPLDFLDTSLVEQLQSTNTNFIQDGDTLYIIGGYGFSASQQDHVTYPYLTTIIVSEVIDAIINQRNFSPFIEQEQDELFAVTGGQLGKINDIFYLIGGHRFEGRYNPRGHGTYVQAYTNEIRQFKISNTDTLRYDLIGSMRDEVHLHRRDFNLVPQIFPNGEFGYVISSGVFQREEDLPFAYPVEISTKNYKPVTEFNQYLSNYHSANVQLYDATNQINHTLFLGGLSQYYFQNDSLIYDELVPFVSTISRLSHSGDGAFREFVIPEEMPELNGTSAEFIPNLNENYLYNELFDLDKFTGDSVLIGHVCGGINSDKRNPFSRNNTEVTEAASTIYAIYLKRNSMVQHRPLGGENPYTMNIVPNKSKTKAHVTIALDDKVDNLRYYVTDDKGNIVLSGLHNKLKNGTNKFPIKIKDFNSNRVLKITLVLNSFFTLSFPLYIGG